MTLRRPISTRTDTLFPYTTLFLSRASALRFAAEGAKLVIGDKSAAIHDTAQAVTDAGGEVVALAIDAGVEADVAKLVTTAKETSGAIDIACDNAGIIGDLGGIFDFDHAPWAETPPVNLHGPELQARQSGQGSVAPGRGRSVAVTTR